MRLSKGKKIFIEENMVRDVEFVIGNVISTSTHCNQVDNQEKHTEWNEVAICDCYRDETRDSKHNQIFEGKCNQVAYETIVQKVICFLEKVKDFSSRQHHFARVYRDKMFYLICFEWKGNFEDYGL